MQQLQQARVLVELGRFAEALALLGQVISAEPQNAEAWCLVAQARLSLDEDSGALDAAGVAASLDPTGEWPHRLASIALERLEQTDRSLWAAREAVRCGPHSWAAFARLASAAMRAGQMREARSATKQALALAPHESFVHVVAGNVALKAGETRRAQAAFRRALEIDPQNASAHDAVGAFYLRQSSFGRGTKLAQAAGGFATALRADPSQDVSRQNLDLIVRVFLSRLAYFVFVVAFLGDVLRESREPMARVAPVLLLVIPAAFGGAFLRRLTPDVRLYLSVSVCRRELRIPLVLGLVATVMLTAATVLPQTAREASAVGATFAAAICGIWLYLQVRRHGLQHGVPLRTRPFTTPVLWWIAGTFALMGGFLLLSVFGMPGTGKGALPISFIFIAGFLATVWVIRRRHATGRR
jgi:tetratricopeptide (TPR) repeat protein